MHAEPYNKKSYLRTCKGSPLCFSYEIIYPVLLLPVPGNRSECSAEYRNG